MQPSKEPHSHPPAEAGEIRRYNMKTSHIQLKIEPALKEKFFAWCKAQAINPSEWLRLRIAEAVKEK